MKMTNEEAIGKLKREQATVCFGCMHPQVVGWCEEHCRIPEALDMAIKALEDRPSGKWIEDGYNDIPCACSYCGEEGKREYDYCPHCGTKMERRL